MQTPNYNDNTICRKFSMTKCDKNVKEIAAASIQKDLLTLEEQEASIIMHACIGDIKLP